MMPLAKPLPSTATLHRLLTYDPETGLFTFRLRGEPKFDAQYGGRPALRRRDKDGHLRGRLATLGAFYAHRVAFKMMHGRDPCGDIDHINGDPGDNRISNLREATSTENRLNSRVGSTNKSGRVGVCWHKAERKWAAYIGVGRTRHRLGAFSSKLDAIAAREQAERDLGVPQLVRRSA